MKQVLLDEAVENKIVDSEPLRAMWLTIGLELINEHVAQEKYEAMENGNHSSETETSLNLFFEKYESCFDPKRDHPNLGQETISMIHSQKRRESANGISSNAHSMRQRHKERKDMVQIATNEVIKTEADDLELFYSLWLIVGLELVNRHIAEEEHIAATNGSNGSNGRNSLKGTSQNVKALKLFLERYESCFQPGQKRPSFDKELINIIFSQEPF